MTSEDQASTGTVTSRISLRLAGIHEQDGSPLPGSLGPNEDNLARSGLMSKSPDMALRTKRKSKLTQLGDHVGTYSNVGAEEMHEMDDEGRILSSGAKAIGESMYKSWKQQRFIDVVFHTKGEDVLAHKLALAAYSEQIADKLNAFPRGEIISIDWSDVSEKTTKAIVEFHYTDEINLDDHIVIETWYCARENGIEEISSRCLGYINQYLEPHNALIFLNYAKQYHMKDIEEMMKTFILMNFMAVADEREFANIPIEDLIPLLQSDDLVVKSEIEVFKAIVRWVDHRRADRLKLAPNLLKLVRHQLIRMEEVISEIETTEWMFKRRETYNWMFDCMRYHALKSCGSTYVASYPVQSARRRSDDNQVAREVVNKPTLHYLRTQGTTGEKARDWSGPAIFPEKQVQKVDGNRIVESDSHAGYGQVSKTHKAEISNQAEKPYGTPTIIAVGGIDLQRLDAVIPGRHVYKFDPLNNEWSIMSTMKNYVHHHGVATAHGQLYVIGGSINEEITENPLGYATDTVAVYNPRTGVWSTASPMNESRSYFGLTKHKGKFYVMGGENDSKSKLDSIECYDPDTNTWKFVAHMQGGAKVGMAVAVLDNCLYIVGGYCEERTNVHIVNDVECFDLELMRWMKKNPLPLGRSHANLVTVEGRLWLIGGRARNQDDGRLFSLSTVEVYDSKEDEWKHVMNLATARHDAGCVAFGRYIHVVGGVTNPGLDDFMSVNFLSSVECIDTGSYQRVRNFSELPHPSAGIACAYLRKKNTSQQKE